MERTGCVREVAFIGSSRQDLQAFPERARRKSGYALQKAQEGGLHIDAKPMKGFGGASVVEVRISDDGDAYRAVYTVAFAEMVYVLHCFQKKAKTGIATPQRDLDLIAQRLKLARADYENHHPGA
jgi:phage-related protein